jgi:hypothetical protein
MREGDDERLVFGIVDNGERKFDKEMIEIEGFRDFKKIEFLIPKGETFNIFASFTEDDFMSHDEILFEIRKPNGWSRTAQFRKIILGIVFFHDFSAIAG